MRPRTLILVSLSLSLLAGCGEPKPKASPKTQALYAKHCARCHQVGAANAPKMGDKQAWEKRLKKGKGALLQTVKKGLVAMPPNGGCDECTDDDFRELIKYLSH